MHVWSLVFNKLGCAFGNEAGLVPQTRPALYKFLGDS